jgi:hypothetical protein
LHLVKNLPEKTILNKAQEADKGWSIDLNYASKLWKSKRKLKVIKAYCQPIQLKIISIYRLLKELQHEEIFQFFS